MPYSEEERGHQGCSRGGSKILADATFFSTLFQYTHKPQNYFKPRVHVSLQNGFWSDRVNKVTMLALHSHKSWSSLIFLPYKKVISIKYSLKWNGKTKDKEVKPFNHKNSARGKYLLCLVSMALKLTEGIRSLGSSDQKATVPGETSSQTKGHHPERQCAPASLPENSAC